MDPVLCPVCSTKVRRCIDRFRERDGSFFDCPNCGVYVISGSELACVQTLEERERAVLSHRIWMGNGAPGPFLVGGILTDSIKGENVPDSERQIELLVSFLATNQRSPGSFLEIGYGHLRAKIGALNEDD